LSSHQKKDVTKPHFWQAVQFPCVFIKPIVFCGKASVLFHFLR